MITLDQAKIEQSRLQKTANEILVHFDIENRLTGLGQVHRTGSFEYGLMVKPDIDFLILNDNPTVKPLIKIASEMMNTKGIGKVSVANHYIWPKTPGVPKSTYLCIKPVWKKHVWQIDVHVLKPNDVADIDNFPLGWHKQLTQKQRDDILLLKFQLRQLGRYPSEFKSTDIYRAVKNDNVSTITDLENWKIKNPYY